MWARSRIHPSKRLPLQALILFLFCHSAIFITSPLWMLLSEIFKIDEPAARIDYQVWKARFRLRDCYSPRGDGPPDENKIAVIDFIGFW